MKALILSDLHLDQDLDNGSEFILNLPKTQVVILAGDINHHRKTIKKSISYFIDKFEYVLYTPGNHEFYNHYLQEIDDLGLAIEEKYRNFRWLNNRMFSILNQRFLGTTLWYRWTRETHEKYTHWSDFIFVKNSKLDIPDANRKSLDFLEVNTKKEDIVITHMLPSVQCVHPDWVGHQNNCFFVCDCEHIICKNEPKLWIFGHTHSKIHKKILKTEMICNPRGYIKWNQNPLFRRDLFVEF